MNYKLSKANIFISISFSIGREKDVKTIFDNYFEKYDTEGMSVLIFRNQIGDFNILSSHTVVWIGSIDQLNNGFNGELHSDTNPEVYGKYLSLNKTILGT